MSEPLPDPPKKSARALNRWRVGSLSVIQIVLFVVIVIAVNYLSSQYYERRDLSRTEDYTLSPATIRYLQSDALKNRKDPIRWILAYRKSADFYERIRVLADEYSRISGGKIELRIIDPVRNPDDAEELAKAYKLYDPGNSQLSRKDLIVVDARTKEEIAAAATDATPTANHVRIVTAEAMITYTVDQTKPRQDKPPGDKTPDTGRGVRRPTGFQGEDVLTAATVAAIEGVPRKVYFLADKSRIDAQQERSPWKTLVGTLALQNILLEPITLSGKDEIPADAAGVAIVAPKYDFTPEEMAVMERYWQRPRSAFLVLLSPDDVPPRIRGFLRANGVTPRRDRVLTVKGGQTVSSVHAAFTAGIEFTRDLAGQSTTLEGQTSSLEIDVRDDLSSKTILPLPLIQADPEYWGETKYALGKNTFDEKEDKTGPLFLAAGITRGTENDDRFAADSSRMMVMTNTDFLDPDRLHEENLDFLASSMNWMVGREALTGIGPRSLHNYKLPLLNAQMSFINRVNLFFLPAFLLLIASFVWSSRRA